MIALDPNDDWEFIPECDKELESDKQTRFVLKHLDPKEEAYIQDRLGNVTDEGYSVKLGTQSLIALHIGLKEVHNFVDKKGKKIQLKRDKKSPKVSGKFPIDQDYLSRIPKEVRGEVAQAIIEGPQILEPEKKS